VAPGVRRTVSLLSVQVVVTISKPGEKGEVPVGAIVGSAIAGLLLLALAVGLLWKVMEYLGRITLINKPPLCLS